MSATTPTPPAPDPVTEAERLAREMASEGLRAARRGWRVLTRIGGVALRAAERQTERLERRVDRPPRRDPP